MQKVKDVVFSLLRSIDLDLLKAKMAYFFYLGSMGAIYPILSLWMRYRGLSPSQTGALWSTRPFISFLALPLAGLLADRLKIHKKLLIGLAILSLSLRMLMIAEPWLIWIWVLFMLSELSGTPVSSLLDAGVIELLGPERRHLYGKQRVWGSFSYGLVAFLIGAVVSAAGGNFDIYFWSHAAMVVVALLFFFSLSVSSVTTPAPLWQSFGIVFSSVHVFVFFLLITMIGAATGVIGSYLFLVLDELHASRVNMGLATAAACLAEMPFFFFSGPLLRVIGERNMLYMACIGGIFRVMFYTYMKNPWLVLIAETMHGPFFGALWTASMSYIHKIAPPGLGATAQGLLGGLYGGLGNGAGALVGGFIYQRWGYVVLFRATAVFLFFALIIFFFTNAFFKQVNLEAIGQAAAATTTSTAAETTPGNARKDLELDIKTLPEDSSESEHTSPTAMTPMAIPADIPLLNIIDTPETTSDEATTSTSNITSPSSSSECPSPPEGAPATTR